LTALDKHPYSGIRHFPQDAVSTGVRPVNALGQPEGWRDTQGLWHDSFIPTYDSFFPEYFLSGIQTETMVRDLSPITTTIYGTAHGRLTQPAGGQPLQTWITELNMDPSGADPSDPNNVGGPPLAHLTATDVAHLQAKSALRSIAAYVNKGVTAIDFYAAKDGSLSLIDSAFFDAIGRDPGTTPDEGAAGEIPAAIGRFLGGFDGAVPINTPRRLSLLSVDDLGSHMQFAGDGTAAHLPLYDRDVLGFFPFQVNAHRFVIPTYVMTRNVAHLYRPDAPESNPTRYDLPDERFRLTIGGVSSANATVTATDPLGHRSVPVDVLSRSGGQLEVELPVTDSPRLLTIDEGPEALAPTTGGQAGTAVAARSPARLSLVRTGISDSRLSVLATVNRQARRPLQLSFRYGLGRRVGSIRRQVRAVGGRISSLIKLPPFARGAQLRTARVVLRFPGDSGVEPDVARRRVAR
jgi:hypothetical protein